MTEVEWRLRAKCRDVDPEVMHPKWRSEAIAAARRVCAGCPVKDECLQLALKLGDEEGVWGGLIPSERRAYARTGLPRKVPCAGCGRDVALRRGVFHDHNVSRAPGAQMCTESGRKP